MRYSLSIKQVLGIISILILVSSVGGSNEVIFVAEQFIEAPDSSSNQIVRSGDEAGFITHIEQETRTGSEQVISYQYSPDIFSEDPNEAFSLDYNDPSLTSIGTDTDNRVFLARNSAKSEIEFGIFGLDGDTYSEIQSFDVEAESIDISVQATDLVGLALTDNEGDVKFTSCNIEGCLDLETVRSGGLQNFEDANIVTDDQTFYITYREANSIRYSTGSYGDWENEVITFNSIDTEPSSATTTDGQYFTGFKSGEDTLGTATEESEKTVYLGDSVESPSATISDQGAKHIVFSDLDSIGNREILYITNNNGCWSTAQTPQLVAEEILNPSAYYQDTDTNILETRLEWIYTSGPEIRYFSRPKQDITCSTLDTVNENPTDNFSVPEGGEFTFEASITCDGESICRGVEASLTYGENSADKLITDSGTITTNDDNPVECGFLDAGEECILEWSVNNNDGVEGETYHINVETSSENDNIQDSSSEELEVEITAPIVSIDTSWNAVDFGDVSLGEEVGAEDNGNYEIEVLDDSTTEVDLWLRGTDDLQSTQGGSSIPLTNVSWAAEDTQSSSNPLTEDFQLISDQNSPGFVQPIYYWLDVPRGITSGGYESTLIIKGNETA